MRSTNKYILGALLIAASCSAALVAHAAPAMTEPDPARWYIEDTTPQQKFQTLKKEAGAALREARANCRGLQSTDKAACNKEANANFQSDMANANKVFTH